MLCSGCWQWCLQYLQKRDRRSVEIIYRSSSWEYITAEKAKLLLEFLRLCTTVWDEAAADRKEFETHRRQCT